MTDARCRGVLVVDDDPDVRDVLALVLETRGYEVTTAANGQEALDLMLDGARPCLILLDLMMPVMSGGELLARMRSDIRFLDLPVIVLSAWQDLAPEVDGALGFLAKPTDAAQLLGVVEQHRLRENHGPD